MQDAVIMGIVLTVLAGVVMGTSPWPLKLMREFQYEHFAFVSMLFSLIVIPWGITLFLCPNVFSALREMDSLLLVKANLLSLCWGIAQVLALLCFVRIGVSLTYGILVGVASCVGVVVPMIIKASGAFSQAPELDSKAGTTVLCGVAVMLAGVYFASLSGFGREKAQQTESRHSGGFVVGLIMVVLAGALSTGWSFAFAYSQDSIITVMLDHGAKPYPASIAVWALVLPGAALVNALYPAYLMSKNKTWGVLARSSREIGLSLLYGLLFFIPSALLGKGMLCLGALGASVGFGIQQSTMMLGAQGLGFLSGEWRGVSGKPRTQIYLAIVVLIIATVIMAFGNSLT